MSGRELLRYTDTDGDEVFIAHDPVDDSGEDLLLIVHAHGGQVLAARLPVEALREALGKLW